MVKVDPATAKLTSQGPHKHEHTYTTTGERVF